MRAGVLLTATLLLSACATHDTCRTCVGADLHADASAMSVGGSAMDASVDPIDAAAIHTTKVDASGTSPDTGPADATSDARVQTGQAESIEVDCRPAHDVVGSFDSSCQYIGANVPEIVCSDLAPAALGGLRLTVRHAERVQIGQPVVLDGDDPDVAIEFGFADPELLVQTMPDGPMSGTLIFDELRVGEILRGRFVDVRLTAQPDPPFECTIRDASFVADTGPGVRDM